MSDLQPRDTELVKRCLAADEDAWAILIERNAHYVYTLVLRGFRLPPEEAEDVLQETFTQVYEHLADYRSTGPLRAWIGTIARNVARQGLRSRSRHPETSLPLEAADDVQQRALEAVEASVLVMDALAQLEPACGEVLRRFFLLSQKYAEIAAATGIAEGTVASRIARCLIRLRHLLTQAEAHGKK